MRYLFVTISHRIRLSCTMQPKRSKHLGGLDFFGSRTTTFFFGRMIKVKYSKFVPLMTLNLLKNIQIKTILNQLKVNNFITLFFNNYILVSFFIIMFFFLYSLILAFIFIIIILYFTFNLSLITIISPFKSYLNSIIFSIYHNYLTYRNHDLYCFMKITLLFFYHCTRRLQKLLSFLFNEHS